MIVQVEYEKLFIRLKHPQNREARMMVKDAVRAYVDSSGNKIIVMDAVEAADAMNDVTDVVSTPHSLLPHVSASFLMITKLRYNNTHMLLMLCVHLLHVAGAVSHRFDECSMPAPILLLMHSHVHCQHSRQCVGTRRAACPRPHTCSGRPF